MFCPSMFRVLSINTMYYQLTGSIVYHVAKYLILRLSLQGARGGVVVKALRYKPAGRGFDS
jgi:hypothetical protein